jgi:hypothetical protein
MNRHNLFPRAILAWVAAGHLLTGIMLFFSGAGGLAIAKRVYGAAFEPSPQFIYIVRPLGVYMLALGLLELRAAFDPWRFRAVLNVSILVFTLRQIQRIFYAPAVFQALGLTASRHRTGTALFFLILILLIAARFMTKPPPSAGPQS